MFQIAYCYEEIGDLEKAKKSYEEFIAKYPKDQMTESAKFSVKNLGKSADEILQEIQKKNNSK